MSNTEEAKRLRRKVQIIENALDRSSLPTQEIIVEGDKLKVRLYIALFQI